ncbi:MAG: hypothetical protein HOQ24_09175 [Mycobacteriaceae bacterium]|nr:hypothetical protein [Mycobacteriaceae bacterium]
MRRSTIAVFGLVAAVLAIMCGGTAQAAAPVYFNYRGLNCAVSAAGALGCDLPSGMTVMQRPDFLPSGSAEGFQLPMPGRQVVQDMPGGPMHPASLPGTPFTLPGGNPPPVLGPNGCPGRGCTPNPPIRGTQIVCGDGHYMAAGCRTPGGHGFSLTQPGQVSVY